MTMPGRILLCATMLMGLTACATSKPQPLTYAEAQPQTMVMSVSAQDDVSLPLHGTAPQAEIATAQPAIAPVATATEEEPMSGCHRNFDAHLAAATRQIQLQRPM